jgi:hypothetical protein
VGIHPHDCKSLQVSLRVHKERTGSPTFGPSAPTIGPADSRFNSNGPVTSPTDQAIRCYELDYSATAGSTSTASVSAGSTVTVTANGPIYHQGTINVYMSKASPAANSPSAGTGASWFKIYQDTPQYVASSHSLTFPSTSTFALALPPCAVYLQQPIAASTITFTIPKSLPSGQYLIRTEQIALHVSFRCLPHLADFLTSL